MELGGPLFEEPDPIRLCSKYARFGETRATDGRNLCSSVQALIGNTQASWILLVQQFWRLDQMPYR